MGTRKDAGTVTASVKRQLACRKSNADENV